MQEELFNSEKYSQILQMKYETLVQENEYLKNKIPEEKEQLLLLIDDLKNKQNESMEEISKTFHSNCDIITETYSNLCQNEKNKENLILDNLLIDKDKIEEKMKNLNDENEKLREENEKLLEENKKNDEFFANKILEVSTVKGLKDNYTIELKKYEDEMSKVKEENINLRRQNNENLSQIKILENKVKNVNEAIEKEIAKLNEKNGKLVDDLNNQILDLDVQKRELSFNLEQNKKNYGMKIEKTKNIIEENEKLKQNLNEYKIKIGVSEEIINKYTVYSKEVADEMSKKISIYSNANYGIGITGKLNRVDKNNPYGKDNIVYISIYDKNKNRFYNNELIVEHSTREENKNEVYRKIIDMLKQII